MQSKLDQVLAVLKDSELRELRRFLQSAFLNPRQEVLPLLDLLLEARAAGEYPDRKAIALALNPDQPLSDVQVRRLQSYLVKGIEQYLTWQEMTMDPVALDLHLLKAYRRRHLSKGFQAVSNRLKKNLEEATRQDENHHFNRYTFHLEQYNFHVNRAGKEPAKLTGILEELDRFYLVSKLKQACNALNHQRLFKIKYEDTLIQPLLEYIQIKGLNQVPAIAIYYQSYLTLSEEAETHFFALRDEMDAHIALFDRHDQLGIFMLAINFCIRQLNQGKEPFLREVFELYQKALAAGILLENGQLSHWTYKNIVSAGLKLEEFDWVLAFIETYRDLLAPGQQKSSYAFNMAKYYFTLGKWRDGLRLLLPIRFDDLFMQLDARLLQIKCHYELEEFDMVEYQLDNFRKLLKRKELLAYHREHYRNFIDLTRTLIREANHKGLDEKIHSRALLAERDWLLQQVKS